MNLLYIFVLTLLNFEGYMTKAIIDQKLSSNINSLTTKSPNKSQESGSPESPLSGVPKNAVKQKAAQRNTNVGVPRSAKSGSTKQLPLTAKGIQQSKQQRAKQGNGKGGNGGKTKTTKRPRAKTTKRPKVTTKAPATTVADVTTGEEMTTTEVMDDTTTDPTIDTTTVDEMATDGPSDDTTTVGAVPDEETTIPGEETSTASEDEDETDASN